MLAERIAQTITNRLESVLARACATAPARLMVDDDVVYARPSLPQRLWGMSGSVAIRRSQIVGRSQVLTAERLSDVSHDIGTVVPDVVAAGRFRAVDGDERWMVGREASVVVLELQHHRYRRVVVGADLGGATLAWLS